MSNVTIPYGDNAETTAVLLLAAAEEMDLPAGVITTGSFGNFYAPQEVADKAGVDYVADDAVDEPEIVGVDPADTAEPERYLVADETDTDQQDAAYDPADHNVEDVLAYLDENPDQRDAVILAEQQGKNRVTITESQE